MIRTSLLSYLKVTIAVLIISALSISFYFLIAISFQNEPNITVETDAFLLSFFGLCVLGFMLNTAALVFNVLETVTTEE